MRQFWIMFSVIVILGNAEVIGVSESGNIYKEQIPGKSFERSEANVNDIAQIMHWARRGSLRCVSEFTIHASNLAEVKLHEIRPDAIDPLGDEIEFRATINRSPYRKITYRNPSCN